MSKQIGSSLEDLINDKTEQMTIDLLLNNDVREIRDLLSRCDSDYKRRLIEGITQLVGEAIYQGIAAGIAIRHEANDVRNLRLIVN